jgi:hypothetical protein
MYQNLNDGKVINSLTKRLDEYRIASSNSKGLMTIGFNDNKGIGAVSITINKDFINENPNISKCTRNIVEIVDNAVFITCFERIPNGEYSLKISENKGNMRIAVPVELWNGNLNKSLDYFRSKILPAIKLGKHFQFSPLFWDKNSKEGIYRYALDIYIGE